VNSCISAAQQLRALRAAHKPICQKASDGGCYTVAEKYNMMCYSRLSERLLWTGQG
jgi:hypothetical protein